MGGRERHHGAVRRVASHPAVALLLGILLTADILYWGLGRPRHVAVLAAPCAFGSMGRAVHYRIPHALIVEHDGKIGVIDAYSDEASELIATNPTPREVRGWASALPTERTIGLLAPVFSCRQHRFYAYSTDPGRPLSDAEIEATRAAYRHFLEGWNGGALAGAGYVEALAAGTEGCWRFHGLAALHDLAAVGAMVVFAGGVRRTARALRARRRLNAIERAHRCPCCGYDITGIPERCPECGEDITRPRGGMNQWDTPSDPVP